MTGRHNTYTRASPLQDHIHRNQQANFLRHTQTKLYRNPVCCHLVVLCWLSHIVIWLLWQPNSPNCIVTHKSSFIVTMEIRVWRHAQTKQPWKTVTLATLVRINRPITLRVLYKVDDDDNDDDDNNNNNNNNNNFCGFHCLIFYFMRWLHVIGFFLFARPFDK
jgi:hypothetical protein